MVLSMDRWVGKVAVVTGASSGIGAAIAKALVEHGLVVAVLARRKVRLDIMALNLSGKKGKMHAIKTDVSKEDDIIEAFKWVKENLGPVHILVNSAGVWKQSNLCAGDTEVWKNTFDVNVVGLCVATREAIRDMKANNVDGHIIHINSVLGHDIPYIPGGNVYPSSKHAVTALAETLRLELMNAKSYIKVTSLSPGPVDTEILPDFMRKNFRKSFEEKQFLEPENIADAVIYALSTPPHVQIQELTVRSVDESFACELPISNAKKYLYLYT